MIWKNKKRLKTFYRKITIKGGSMGGCSYFVGWVIYYLIYYVWAGNHKINAFEVLFN